MQLTKGLGYGDLLCLNSLHYDFPVFGQFQRWSPKLDVFLFRCIDPLTLSASDFQLFILCNTSKHLNQNRIDHIHDPHLLRRKIGQCSWNVKLLQTGQLKGFKEGNRYKVPVESVEKYVEMKMRT